MKETIKKSINGALSPIGLVVARKETVAKNPVHLFDNFVRMLRDTENLLRAEIFPDLPHCEGRHELITELIGSASIKAFFIVAYLNRALKTDGEVAEFGVAEGATSALIANEIRKTTKNLWLFDSFEGLPKPTEKDILLNDIFSLGSMEKYEGWMACPKESVLKRLKKIQFPLERVKLVPGFIEKTQHLKSLPSKISFAYVDFDFYEPILTALNLIDLRMPVGGHILVDDYGSFSSGGQTATDEFALAHKNSYEFTIPPSFTNGFAILSKVRSTEN